MPKPDVVIIGGGLVGCLCALRLADAGVKVTVLEKSVPGAEASSAAAGILAAQSESREAGTLFSLAIASRQRYVEIADELKARVAAEIGYRHCGVMEIARDEDSLNALEKTFAWQRVQGHRVDRLDAKALVSVEPQVASSAFGAIHFPDDAQVDPPKLMNAVAQCAERAGVSFRAGSVVRRVRVTSGRVEGVDLEDGFVAASQVVVAAGAWSALIEGANLEAGSVRPARGQLVELTMRTPPVSHVVFGEGGYVVPRSDGRVICGSTLEFVGFRNQVTAGGVARILATAMALVPALETAVFSRMWSNFRPHTADAIPLVGNAGIDGLTIATGHYRSGILMAPITAEIVRDKIISGVTQFDVSALDPTRGKPSQSIAGKVNS